MTSARVPRIKLIIFAKAPVPGVVKTRLMPAVGAQGAAQVAKRLLEMTLTQALHADVDAVEMCVSPSPEHEAWRVCSLSCLYAGTSAVLWSDQGTGDLGQRMSRAVARATREGDAVILIGTDCPELTVSKINEAVAHLRRRSVVITPALDGGYVLLGLRRHLPMLFQNIAWSTECVAHETLKRLRFMQIPHYVCEALSDVDEPEDLQRFPELMLSLTE